MRIFSLIEKTLKKEFDCVCMYTEEALQSKYIYIDVNLRFHY